MVKIKQSARLTQLCIMLKDDVSDQLMATSVTCISNLKQPMPVYDTHNGKKKKKICKLTRTCNMLAGGLLELLRTSTKV